MTAPDPTAGDRETEKISEYLSGVLQRATENAAPTQPPAAPEIDAAENVAQSGEPDRCACNDDGYHHRPGCPVVGGVDRTTGETHREVAESMTGLWQAERERADRLEVMCDRLAERIVVLPELWREEGRAVMFNRAGDDLTPQDRVGKWLHEKTRVLPPASTDAGVSR